MDQILDIQLHIDNCFLIAVDTTVPVERHQSFDNFIPVEFITYNEDINPIEPIETSPNTMFELLRDGKYYYYKLMVPTLSHFVGSENLAGLLGEVFYADGLMQVISIPVDSSAEAIKNASKSITALEAYEAVTLNVAPSLEANESYFFPKKEILNICNIRKCLVYLQRKLLLETCGKNNCSSEKDLRQQRDFLLHAVYVLDFLKETGNFEEAQRILDNLSSCGFVCNDKSITFSDCGCGHAI